MTSELPFRLPHLKVKEALEPPILIEPGLEVEIVNQVFWPNRRRVPRTLIWSGKPHVVHNFHRKPRLRLLVAGIFENAV